MYRVLVHVGLPKTATTTIQVNLLYPLHQEGKINFLGRYLVPDSSEYYNPFGHIFSKLNAGLLDKADLVLLRKDLYDIMDKNLINVISEESLTASADGVLASRLDNLKNLLGECEVEVIVSLRNPIDFLFSYYVEMYRWKYSKIKKMDTLDKFIENMIANSNSHEFDTLFFTKILNLISFQFKMTKVVLFEDLKYNLQVYSQAFSNSLGVDFDEVHNRLVNKNQNSRKKTSSGKYSEAITLNQEISYFLITRIDNKIIRYFRKFRKTKSRLRKILKLLSKIPVGRTKEHTYPTQKQQDVLGEYLQNMGIEFCETYNLDFNSLKKYGYFKNTKNHQIQ